VELAEPLDRVMTKFYRFYMISADSCMSLRGVDTSVTCLVFMHCFGSFLLQVMLVSLQIFVFKGQNMKVTMKILFTSILHCDAGPGCD